VRGALPILVLVPKAQSVFRSHVLLSMSPTFYRYCVSLYDLATKALSADCVALSSPYITECPQACISKLRSTQSMLGDCFEVIIDLHGRLIAAGVTDALSSASSEFAVDLRGQLAEVEAFRSKCQESLGTDCRAARISLEAAYQSGRCRLAPLEPSDMDFASTLEAVAPASLQAFCDRDCVALVTKIGLACSEKDLKADVFVNRNLMVARFAALDHQIESSS